MGKLSTHGHFHPFSIANCSLTGGYMDVEFDVTHLGQSGQVSQCNTGGKPKRCVKPARTNASHASGAGRWDQGRDQWR